METSMDLVVGWVIKLFAEALTSSGGDDVNKLCDKGLWSLIKAHAR